MALPVNDKNKGKAGKKNVKQNVQSSKFIAKPAGNSSGGVKIKKTGGTRGS